MGATIDIDIVWLLEKCHKCKVFCFFPNKNRYPKDLKRMLPDQLIQALAGRRTVHCCGGEQSLCQALPLPCQGPALDGPRRTAGCDSLLKSVCRPFKATKRQTNKNKHTWKPTNQPTDQPTDCHLAQQTPTTYWPPQLFNAPRLQLSSTKELHHGWDITPVRLHLDVVVFNCFFSVPVHNPFVGLTEP